MQNQSNGSHLKESEALNVLMKNVDTTGYFTILLLLQAKVVITNYLLYLMLLI